MTEPVVVKTVSKRSESTEVLSRASVLVINDSFLQEAVISINIDITGKNTFIRFKNRQLTSIENELTVF